MKIAELADAYGALDTQIKALTKQRDALRKKFDDFKSDEFVGSTYTIKRCSFESTRLDTKAIKADMDATWVANYSTTSSGTRFTVAVSAQMADA